MNESANILEFNTIIQQLCDFALSERAKQKLGMIKPYLSEKECRDRMQETTGAKTILEAFGSPPLTAMHEIDKMIELCQKGSMLTEEQLVNINQFISACKRIKSYFKKAECLSVSISQYGHSIYDMSELYAEIDRCIRNNRVDDLASSTLRDIRRKIENAKAQVKSKLDSILKSKRAYVTDGYVSVRNGHYVLPVKKEYKNQIAGTVIDVSSTGSTCFIEPDSVKKLQTDLTLLEIEQDNEIRKILYTLTALVEEQIPLFRINMDALEILDCLFAKAKLSIQMNARPVLVATTRKIIMKQARHPLLQAKSCVPLDFEIGNDVNGVIITGPNTGGKTVALKTVGLLSMMAQSGLHVPVDEGSVFCMHNLILCDIGDGQSISENLSTFSSHITNIIKILNNADEQSLVLLDELGSGTDPAEGMGIAVAILEELKAKGCLFVATTHYPEIKEYAQNTPMLINARMAFDRESLNPLYQLEIGEAGESCALYIAQRLGFPSHLLSIAKQAAYRNPMQPAQANVQIQAELPIKPATSHAPKIKPMTQENKSNRSHSFAIGDSVFVLPKKEIGIVYQPTNERGEIGVQVKGVKMKIPHKRIQLNVKASELYPPDYDFSIIFDTVENRKAHTQMQKRHDPNVKATYKGYDNN